MTTHSTLKSLRGLFSTYFFIHSDLEFLGQGMVIAYNSWPIDRAHGQKNPKEVYSKWESFKIYWWDSKLNESSTCGFGSLPHVSLIFHKGFLGDALILLQLYLKC